MLTRADHYLKNAIEKIKMEGFIDKNPRPHWNDGSPAHTISINHVIRTYDLSKGDFPITTLRPIYWKSAIKEMLWIYQDQTSSLDILQDKYKLGNIWYDWESEMFPKTIGYRYGHTVKKYKLIDKLINDIKNNPYGRRHIMDLWQEEEFSESDGLYPCAFLTIWNVRNEYIDMCLIQRSGDMITASGAGCFNECGYAALLMMVANVTGYRPGVFTHFIANEQIYDRHKEIANELLIRYKNKEHNVEKVDRPRLIINQNIKDFYDYTIDDFTMLNYNPIKPQIKIEVAI